MQLIPALTLPAEEFVGFGGVARGSAATVELERTCYVVPDVWYERCAPEVDFVDHSLQT